MRIMGTSNSGRKLYPQHPVVTFVLNENQGKNKGKRLTAQIKYLTFLFNAATSEKIVLFPLSLNKAYQKNRRGSTAEKANAR